MDLHCCRTCGHIFNASFDKNKLQYGPEYENSQGYSPLFRQYLHTLALRLISTHPLREKQILEIGCGQGEFLQLLCTLGQNTGRGIDPGYRPIRLRDGDKDIQYVTETFDPDHTVLPQNGLICFRHVLEHLDRPGDFLRRIGERLRPGAGTVLYCEVPNAEFMIRENRIWDLLYEHCSYFVRKSLVHIFSRAGFRILNIREDFGGQFLCCEAVVSSGSEHPIHSSVSESVLSMFSETLEDRISQWQARAGRAHLRGERIGLWGAGTKGVMLANQIPLANLECLIDINPRKQGKFVACAGHAIIAPLSLRHAALDRIFITNPTYHNEIEDILAKSGLTIPIEPV